MIHWLEQTLLGSAMFSAGAVWQWFTQRGTCRGCRIRYSVRQMLSPIISRIVKQAPLERRRILGQVFRVLEVALAFAFWDTMKLGWHLAVMPYFNQKFRRTHHDGVRK